MTLLVLLLAPAAPPAVTLPDRGSPPPAVMLPVRPLNVPVGDRLEERDFRGWRVLVRCATPGGEGVLVRPLYPLPGAREVAPAAPFPGGSTPGTTAPPVASPPVRLTYGPGLFPGATGTPARGVIRRGGIGNPFGGGCPPSG